ncbi:hypothetical protein HK100_005139, partial [Physocladia obscura]
MIKHGGLHISVNPLPVSTRIPRWRYSLESAASSTAIAALMLTSSLIGCRKYTVGPPHESNTKAENRPNLSSFDFLGQKNTNKLQISQPPVSAVPGIAELANAVKKRNAQLIWTAFKIHYDSNPRLSEQTASLLLSNLEQIVHTFSSNATPASLITSNSYDAIETILKSLNLWHIHSKYLRNWLYILIYRAKLPLVEIWGLIERLEEESQKSTSLEPATLHPSSLQFMLEAELRKNKSGGISVIGRPNQKYRNVADYIKNSEIQLTLETCKKLMLEYAAFSDSSGAKDLLEYMRDKRISRDLTIFELAVVAITRRNGLEFNSFDIYRLFDEMKTLCIKPSTRLFNTLIRWSQNANYDSDDANRDDIFWTKRMFDEGVQPSLATLTILVQSVVKFNFNEIVEPSLHKIISDIVGSIFGDKIKLNLTDEGNLTKSSLMETFTRLVTDYTVSGDSHAAFV